MKRIILFAIAAIFWGSQAQASWDLNDVSYILPLPNQALSSVSIRATELNLPAFSILNDLMPGDLITRSVSFDPVRDLFLVSVRVDPCFKDLFTDNCKMQIRAVFQPVDHWREDRPLAVDATVHLFFNLSAQDFPEFLTQLQALKSQNQVATAGSALGLHPGFSKTAPTAFQKDFRNLLLTYLTSSRLARIAVMRLESFSLGWELKSVNVNQGVATPLKIFPGTSTVQEAENQYGIRSITPNGLIDSNALPAELEASDIHSAADQGFRQGFSANVNEAGDQLLKFFMNSKTALAPPGSTQAILQRVGRVQNPAVNLPGTIDCLSCHISSAAKGIAQKAAGTSLPQPGFSGHYNLSNASYYYGDSHSLRMLGYLNDKVQISDRAIYESAHVADELNVLH